MRAVVLTETGGPEVLRVQEWPEPALGPGEVRVEVAAAGVNFADVLACVGLYPEVPALPCVIGYEIAGTVMEVAPEVEGVEVGQRVFAGTRFGGYAEQAVIPGILAWSIPERLSFEQAAAIPVNYSTAWFGLVRYGNVWPGERVLIHAAAGGVGIAATRLAKSLGAEVWGTASPAKHDAIRGFGVEHPIDYRREGWQEGLPQFDLVLDGIGGSSFKTSYELLRPGGRLIAIGSAGAVSGDTRVPRFPVRSQVLESKAVIGVNVLRLWDAWGDENLPDELINLLRSDTLEPIVAETFSFENAPDAHRMLLERRNVGKVVLVPA